MKTLIKTFYAYNKHEDNSDIIVRAENQVNEFLNEEGKIRELVDMKIRYTNEYPHIDVITIAYIEKECH